MWGDYSQATNFLSGRRSPTRFVYQPYLYEAGFGDTLVREFLDDLRSRPPTLIIDTSPSSAPYLERPSLAALGTTWPADRPADFAAAWREVAAHLKENYERVSTLSDPPGWIVYRLRQRETADWGARPRTVLVTDA